MYTDKDKKNIYRQGVNEKSEPENYNEENDIEEEDNFMDCEIEQWDLDDIADYYGYQQNDEYSASQFLDDIF